MSDVTVNPAPSAPVSPAPASPPSNEVVVNQSPTNSPQAVGSQAPPKPEGQVENKSSNVSRREAIANAFKRSEEARAEAAKAEPAKKQQQKSANQQQKSADQNKTQPQERYREGGKFARDPAKPQPDQQVGQVSQQGQQPGQQGQPRQLEPNAPFREPPQRFSDQAKGEWANAPESVRGAVHQMTREFQGAYEKYRGDHEVMNALRPYHEMATKQGTTLERALGNYTAMEGKLRSDFFGGLEVLTSNMGWKHPDGSPVTFRDIAYHYLNRTPEQHQLSQQQNQQTASDMRIGQLHQMVEKLTQGLGQIQYQQKYSATRSQVDAFAAKHPRFDVLADLIKVELDHGYTLEQAYLRANMLRPDTTAAQTRNTPAQTRRTSISGAPDGNGSTRPAEGRRNADGKTPTRREAIAKAMRRASNGI